MHVDRAGALNYPGTILAVDKAKASYKVRMDGDGEISWMNAAQLKYSCEGPAGGAKSPAFYAGAWDLFMGPAPQYETRGNDVYLVVGIGAQALPIRIDRDGGYSWRTYNGVIEGRWQALPAGQDKYHRGTPAILLLAGEDGKDWQMWSQGLVSRDNREQVTLERWDSGVSYLATRRD